LSRRSQERMTNAAPVEAGAHLSAARATGRWVPAFAGTAGCPWFHPGRVGRRPVATNPKSNLDLVGGAADAQVRAAPSYRALSCGITSFAMISSIGIWSARGG